MTVQEAVEKTLKHIQAEAKRRTTEYAYDTLFAIPELPTEAFGEIGAVTALESGDSDILPSLLLEVNGGQTQIELCPFGPLALLSSDGVIDTDPFAQALSDAGIAPLFPADLDNADEWEGAPLGAWLFPHRLSDALTRFDALRERLTP